MSEGRAPQPNRINGGLVDRSRPLRFRFDGKHYQGFQGDTLASALLANGVRLVGRSFKYHRPRGIMTTGPEEPNALVVLRNGTRREPNTRATTAELYDGLEAQSQNRWPSLRRDVFAVNDLLSRFLPAGFYYKTFMAPGWAWERLYEPPTCASLATASPKSVHSRQISPMKLSTPKACCSPRVSSTFTTTPPSASTLTRSQSRKSPKALPP